MDDDNFASRKHRASAPILRDDIKEEDDAMSNFEHSLTAMTGTISLCQQRPYSALNSNTSMTETSLLCQRSAHTSSTNIGNNGYGSIPYGDDYRADHSARELLDDTEPGDSDLQ